MDNLEMFNALLNLSTYHHPENIVLPKGSVQQAAQAFSKQEPASDCDWSLGVKVFSYLVIFSSSGEWSLCVKLRVFNYLVIFFLVKRSLCVKPIQCLVIQ